MAQKAGSTLGQVLAQRELRFRAPPGRLLVAPRLLAAPGGSRRLLAAARVRLPGKGGEAAGAENEQLYKERLTETQAFLARLPEREGRQPELKMSSFEERVN